jgi:hypothetical protein
MKIEEVLLFKTEYDKRMEKVAGLKELISDQIELTHKAAISVADQMIELIEKHLAGGGDLHKLAGPHGLLKSANVNARAAREALRKLQAECVNEQARANEVFPEHVAWLTEMRVQVPPAGGGRFFSTTKGGSVQPAVDLNRAAFDAQLATRFQGK